MLEHVAADAQSFAWRPGTVDSYDLARGRSALPCLRFFVAWFVRWVSRRSTAATVECSCGPPDAPTASLILIYK